VTVVTRDNTHYDLDNKLFSFERREEAFNDADLGPLRSILNSLTVTFRDLTLYNLEGLEEQIVERTRFSGSPNLETTETKTTQYFFTNGQVSSYDIIRQGDDIPTLAVPVPPNFLTFEVIHRDVQSYTLFDQLYAFVESNTNFIPPLTSLGALPPAGVIGLPDDVIPGERTLRTIDRTV
jgi:hypothetical protein